MTFRIQSCVVMATKQTSHDKCYSLSLLFPMRGLVFVLSDEYRYIIHKRQICCTDFLGCMASKSNNINYQLTESEIERFRRWKIWNFPQISMKRSWYVGINHREQWVESQVNENYFFLWTKSNKTWRRFLFFGEIFKLFKKLDFLYIFSLTY